MNADCAENFFVALDNAHEDAGKCLPNMKEKIEKDKAAKEEAQKQIAVMQEIIAQNRE